jgi:threonyl-tRNA synthetase
VVGEDEQSARAVNVRNRDDVGTKARTPTIPLDDVLVKLVKLKEERRLENQIE